MKRIGIVFVLLIFSGFIVGQDAFAFSDPPTKDEKQLMSAVFLTGFVGIYGGIIYLRKSSQIQVRNQKKLFHTNYPTC